MAKNDVQKMKISGTEDLPDICGRLTRIQTDHGSVDARIFIHDQAYYVAFSCNGVLQEVKLCPICTDAVPFLAEFAEWAVDDFLAERQLEVIMNELYHHAKK